jgi:predicted regulator of Ras-like GTPase activity (Roadblock/LC7/MglB family)
MATDDIRALSEALAADPSSTVFLELADALRRRGQLDLAFRVAVRGLERHPQRTDAHDLVARVAIDRLEFERAKSEWETVLTLDPGNIAATKGLGFLAFQQGDLQRAGEYFGRALEASPEDPSIESALETVRATLAEAKRQPWERPTAMLTPMHTEAVHQTRPFAPVAADARTLFAEILGDEPQTALLIDADGYVVAGQYVTAEGQDIGADLGAQLSGVSEEASRAMRHLGLGEWRQIVFEAEAASVAMAPSGAGILLVATPRSVPLGFVRRLLERSLERARRWLESGT